MQSINFITSENPVRGIYFLPLLLIFLIFSFGCSGSKKIISPQTEKNIKIDGDLSDWPRSKALIKRESYFDYYATHDSSRLYIYVNLKSDEFTNTVENTGFTVYLSTNKKNRKALGITYPVGAYNYLEKYHPGRYQKFIQNRKWLRKPSNQRLLVKLRRRNYRNVMISQKQNKKQKAQEVIVDMMRLEAQGIQVARNKLHRKIQLEFSIPLNSTKTQQFAVVPGKDNRLQLGFTVNPPEHQWDTGSTTVDLSKQGPGRGRYGRYRDRKQLQARLNQLTDARDQWFTLKLTQKNKSK